MVFGRFGDIWMVSLAALLNLKYERETKTLLFVLFLANLRRISWSKQKISVFVYSLSVSKAVFLSFW